MLTNITDYNMNISAFQATEGEDIYVKCDVDVCVGVCNAIIKKSVRYG